jgi:chromate reductase
MTSVVRHVGLIVGSLRRESINRKLADAIIQLSPPGLKFFDIPLGDLPMYNGDLEIDRPEPVRRFTDECRRSRDIRVLTGAH